MKSIRMSVQLVAMIVSAALVLVFMGTAAFAAAPDADVEGLWLKASAFPEDNVEVLAFKNDLEMEIVKYTRMLDGLVTFEIRRQLIEESELQTPRDVPSLIEIRVENDDIDEKVLEENRGSINVDTDASEFAEMLTYPCAMAEYITGADEDIRMHAALFVFTDKYSFEVSVSMPADAYQDFQDKPREWFASLRFVE